jgi:prolyl oligopeptidase
MLLFGNSMMKRIETLIGSICRRPNRLHGARSGVGCLFALLLISTAAAEKPPESRRSEVTDTYHGVTVREDFRWLEDWSSAEVKQWSNAQNECTRRNLDALPHVGSIRKQVTKILSAESSSYDSLTFRNGKLFAIKHQPPKQQPFLVVMQSYSAPETARILVDPNTLDEKGTIAIDWYKVSPDGQYVAVSLSSGGSEAGDLSIFSTTTGEEVFEKIAYVNSGTAGGSLAWSPDSAGYFYTRHIRIHPEDLDDINVFQHVYHHRLGSDPKQDTYELGKGFPQIAEIQLAMNNSSGHLLATVQKGDGGQFAHYMRTSDRQWQQFSKFGDGTKQAVFGPHNDLYIVTLNGAPRGELLRVSLDDLSIEDAETVLPQGADSIVTSGIAFWGERTVVPTKSRIYVVYQLGGPSVIRTFDHDGRIMASPRQLEVASVHGLLPLEGDDLLFGNTSFIDADAFYHYNADADRTTRTAIADKASVEFSDAEVIREFATSPDGTKVPLNIIVKKNTTLNGSHACIVTGYGGYGINITPRFRATNRLLLDYDVIYVVANLRGGGEFGEQWHLAGNLTRKQNVFDDFAAVLQHLIDRGYTQSRRLGITGGSNGGLLMGATMTQHPKLVSAVVSRVGIYDMLRVELSANGAFNVTEFGTVKNAAQFEALYAYSPYHNVRDDVSYPATMFVTGANDPRVDPMQSRKMTARLQAVTRTKTPILLRTSANSGHGLDQSLSQSIEQSVDIYSFLFKHLGVRVK